MSPLFCSVLSVSPRYVKVNCRPFFFELVLYGEIDYEASEAHVENCEGGGHAVKFVLRKKREEGSSEFVVWPALTPPDLDHRKGDAEKTAQWNGLRDASMRAYAENEERKRVARREEVTRQEKLAFEKNWDVERQKRAEMEDRRNEERRLAFSTPSGWIAVYRKSIVLFHVNSIAFGMLLYVLLNVS